MTQFSDAFARAKGKPLTRKEKRDRKKSVKPVSAILASAELPQDWLAQRLAAAREFDLVLRDRREAKGLEEERKLLPRTPRPGFQATPVLKTTKLTRPSFPRKTTKPFAKSYNFNLVDKRALAHVPQDFSAYMGAPEPKKFVPERPKIPRDTAYEQFMQNAQLQIARNNRFVEKPPAFLLPPLVVRFLEDAVRLSR